MAYCARQICEIAFATLIVIGEFDLRSLATGYLCLFLSLSSSAFGQAEGVSVDSFRVIETTPNSVDIELIASNDGSLGTICLGTLAKSEDGSVQSETSPPIIVPVGRQLILAAEVSRPRGLNKQHTDYLLVTVYPCGREPVLTLKLAWSYDWTDRSASTASSDIETQVRDDAATSDPYWVVANDLQVDDFAALDRLLKKWNHPEQRDRSGEWKLDSFKRILANSCERNWKGCIERIQRWRKTNPESTSAVIAEASYWIAYAWSIRGGEYNSSTDPVAVKVFDERMKRAEQVLKASKQFASSNPLWYETYLDVAVGTRRNRQFIAKLFTEGMHRHPYFQSLYLAMANYWSPPHGGSPDWAKVDEVIGNAVVLTAITDGISNYARLYKRVNDHQKLEFDLFQDSLASWPKMRDSFDELIRRYPSPENINEFASYACQAEDKDTYLRLRARMKDHLLPYKWRDNYSPDMCDHKFMLYS